MSTTSLSSASSHAAEVPCARHPSTTTGLRCGRCDTPICPRCMINTEVGQRCPDCARGRRLPTFQVSPAILARGAGVGVLAATALGFVWSLVPGFAFWLGLLMGFGVGEAFAWATNRKRGRGPMLVAGASVLVGFLLGYVGLGAGNPGAVLAVVLNPLLLLRMGIFGLIGLVLAVAIAAGRQRG